MTDQQNHPYLFVGGCPRSGTTLLQRMMDHHPQLAVANDAHFIPRALENADSRYYDLALSGAEIPLTEDLVRSVWDYHRFYRLGVDESSFQHIARQCDTFQQLVRELFAWFARQRGKVLSGEKTPDYVRHVPLLRSLFPDSRFVHIVRDGRDVALSLQQWAKVDKGPSRLALWDEDPVSVSALWWRDFVQSPTEQGTHHTPGRLDGRYLLVRYEDLLEDPHAVLTQIVDDFLRLPFSDRMMKFHEGKTANSKSGSASAVASGHEGVAQLADADDARGRASVRAVGWRRAGTLWLRVGRHTRVGGQSKTCGKGGRLVEIPLPQT